MENKATVKKHKKKRHPILRFFGVVGTLLLIFVCTCGIFAKIFMTWVNTSLKGNTEIYIDEFESKVSTELYYQQPDSEEWVMYQTLFMAGEDRIWVGLDDIPKSLQNAAVAIEDKRFYIHEGVDWKSTVRAIVYTLTGNNIQGGSTITQQLIKNLTEDDETTVKRKATEIYRALEMETRYEKEEILEAYLNEIYLGRSCYGVEAASLRYYGKHVEELDLAESCCLIAITNNPSMYGPFESDWARGNNRKRQVLILDAMLEQEMITQSEYNRAKNEEVVFSNGYTNFGNKVDDHLESVDIEELEEQQKKEQAQTSTAWNSYYTDAVIEDVAEDLMSTYGYDYRSAINLVYGGGYKIYTAQDINIQKTTEAIFENLENVPYPTNSGEQLQGAITIMDPYTGYVVAMVGGTGAKTVDRGWNWATAPRPCGSAVKPISTYAPALDNGTINAASTIDDFPMMILNRSAWPKNDHAGFYGLSSVRTSLVQSLNTSAVRVCQQYGVFESYEFMTNKLGFTTLTAEDSQQTGNMALGGFSVGVTTEEMCAAYCIFPNEGIYTKPRTYTKVVDANGNVILSNDIDSHIAIKATTACIMNSILSDVVTKGTGTAAHFSGMSIAGKTGTTNNQRDRYFVGYSPYYCAAVWVGYESNAKISSGGVNPAAVLWRKVMSEVHQNLENKPFNDSTGLVQVDVCADSGMLATGMCEMDPRGSRVITVTCASDNVPEESCTMHTGFGRLNYTRTHYVDFPNIVADDDDFVYIDWDREFTENDVMPEWYNGSMAYPGFGYGMNEDYDLVYDPTTGTYVPSVPTDSTDSVGGTTDSTPEEQGTPSFGGEGQSN